MANEIDLLSGKVDIDAPRPPGLENELVRFFEHPNDAKWGPVICRSLYHESLHFWQLLGFGFVAAWVSEDWKRLLEFERTGGVPPLSPIQQYFNCPEGDGGFSAKQLLECWTRSWEVHTRGAATIIAEERLNKQIDFSASGAPIFDSLRPYTGEAYDYVMLHGPCSGLYERPYRWVLDAFDEDSYVAALMFPLACYGAFRSPDPVAFFEQIVSDAALLMRRDRLFEAPPTRIINYDWAIHARDLLERLLPPLFSDANVSQIDGFSVISSGPLATHPVYPDYLERCPIQDGYVSKSVDRFKGGLKGGSQKQRYDALVANFASEDPSHVFLCPGEPLFRDILATAYPPVRIAFEDGNIDVDHVPMRKLLAVKEPAEFLDDYSARIDSLIDRVGAFRTAEIIERLQKQ